MAGTELTGGANRKCVQGFRRHLQGGVGLLHGVRDVVVLERESGEQFLRFDEIRVRF